MDNFFSKAYADTLYVGAGYVDDEINALAIQIAAAYQPLDADLTALAALAGTNTIYYRSGANTWSAVTIGSNLTFSGGTLSASGGSGDALTTNPLSQFAATTSAQLAGVISDETGSGSLVFGTSPTFAGGTVTSSSPIQSLTQTWNAGATTFIGVDVNITDTASANGSKIIDFRSGGTSRISINKVASAANHTAPFRLTFADAAGLAWSPEWGAITVRNAANTADANFRAEVFNANRAVTIGDYLTTPAVEVAHAGWRGTGRAITLINSVGIAWSSTTAISGTADLSLTRNAANIAQLGNGANNASGSLLLTNLTASGLLCAGIYTVATLPTASSNAYKFANVSDSSVTAFGTTVAGGGSSKVMVYSNGTNWTVAAA